MKLIQNMEKRIKILHVWDMAGVAHNISKYLPYEFDSHVVYRKKMRKYGFDSPNSIFLEGSTLNFYLWVLAHARKYDIIHIHTINKIVIPLRILYPRKKIIMTYHGTELRLLGWKKSKKYVRYLDKVTVSTPDLLPEDDIGYDVQYVENMVDIDNFKEKNIGKTKTALYIIAYQSKEELIIRKRVEELVKRDELQLTIIDRNVKMTKYTEMANLLKNYEYYMDIKMEQGFDDYIKSLSLTALQFLYMGGKVYFQDQIITSFPNEYHPQIVIKKWINIYKSLLE